MIGVVASKYAGKKDVGPEGAAILDQVKGQRA